MRLLDLVENVEYKCLQGNADIEVNELVYDSRKVTKGDVFVCISGAVRDAHDFVPDVIEKGAAAVIVEKDMEAPEGVCILKVDNSRLALSQMSAAFFGYPAKELKTIGITGTKGKTTTTYLVKAMLEKAGIKTGLVGTIETIIGDKATPALNTTPESYVLQKTFREMVDAGLECVVMEVSSQGLMLHRVGGFTFDYGIFTNLEPDHIGPNEHKDMDDYISCKAMLFKQCKHGIFNIDSEYCKQVMEGHTCEVETFGYSKEADLQAENVELFQKPQILGVSYDINVKKDGEVVDKQHIVVDIPGDFSVYNSLCAVAICRHFGVSFDVIREAAVSTTVKGRVELIPVSPKYTLMIDYAHNAMALESLLTTLRAYNPKRLVCLFGCGGNRSKLRRFEMGEISSKLADLTVVTSDNPRDEEPQAIMDDIVTGVKKADGAYVTIENRKEAIKYCMDNAKEGDVIVLAGKGHEDYQEIKGKKYKMDERDLIREILQGI
ncbi:MAG: UDP-N-acetylmuramoyl-L-alanyl-D-glutamate--2,6-diaminopimelate ligase [Lachnospiraceae bacterium]|nr:UDP-N-acetylmuramoyl-L-alanyl-D-glutamate--2,6-diaminopimelate ligase [Lachnospiraceae bacterium]